MPRERTAGQATGTAARERIVRAAQRCFTRFGITKTTVEDIATAAGMARATVYRHFSGGRDEVVLTVLLRDGRRILDRLSARLAEEQSVSDAVVEGILLVVDFVRRQPGQAVLFAPEMAGDAGAIPGAPAALHDLCVEYVSPFFDQAKAAGVLRTETDVDGTVELLLRIIISLVTMPAVQERSDDDTRRFLHTYVVPALVPEGTESRETTKE